MSENTEYFAVKSDSATAVKDKLNAAGIKSVVEADERNFGFMPEYKREGGYNWVLVEAPAESGIQDGEYVYKNQFDRMAETFETLILFFEQEISADWSLKLKSAGNLVFKKFYTEENTVFNEEEKSLFSSAFDRDFSELQPFLQPGKGADFLNFVGIPYFEMVDQDLVPDSIFSETCSLLSHEIQD